MLTIFAKIIKEFENLSVEKKTLSTALGFEPRSFDCRSTVLTTELHRRPKSNSPLFIILGSSLGNLINLKKKFLFLFQVQISIFRIFCRGRPPNFFFFFLDTAILSRNFVFLTKQKKKILLSA